MQTIRGSRWQLLFAVFLLAVWIAFLLVMAFHG
jgi:hypothetical protein